jgi:ABC-2 type transport system ATP-binding protein
MPEGAAICTDQLRKEFGERVAVKDLTLQVEQGEVFGFLGPNGAGKTTAMKMLLGLIAPTAGHGSVLGAPLGDHRALARTGFLPEHFRFQEWLTAREFLELHGQLWHMPAQDLRKRLDELLERVGLSEFRHRQLHTFSKGMLQRIGLAQALLNHPSLVFLDEPTSGLDPIGRRLVRDIIHELHFEGTSVFLNSHLLSEIEVTCDRVAFIRHGEVVRVMEWRSLDPGPTVVSVQVRGLSAQALDGLAQWGKDLHVEGERIRLAVANEAFLPEIVRYLVAQGVEVYSLVPSRKSLEEIFVETIGQDGGL